MWIWDGFAPYQRASLTNLQNCCLHYRCIDKGLKEARLLKNFNGHYRTLMNRTASTQARQGQTTFHGRCYESLHPIDPECGFYPLSGLETYIHVVAVALAAIGMMFITIYFLSVLSSPQNNTYYLPLSAAVYNFTHEQVSRNYIYLKTILLKLF